MYKFKVAIVDDDDEFRDLLAETLGCDNSLEVLFTAENGYQLLEKLRFHKPNIVLFGIDMPHLCGVASWIVMRENYPMVKAIALSQVESGTKIVELAMLGVRNFVGKEDPQEVLKAVKAVAKGGVYVADQCHGLVQRGHTKQELYKHLLKGGFPTFSEEERRLAKLLIEGLTSKEIGEKIFKSHRTVDDMRNKLYSKLNVRKKEQFIALAVQINLVTL